VGRNEKKKKNEPKHLLERAPEGIESECGKGTSGGKKKWKRQGHQAASQKPKGGGPDNQETVREQAEPQSRHPERREQEERVDLSPPSQLEAQVGESKVVGEHKGGFGLPKTFCLLMRGGGVGRGHRFVVQKGGG